MRLALLYSHPVQYAAPLFRELSRRPGVDLTVYFLSRHGVDVTYDPSFQCSFKWDIPLLEGYACKFLPNAGKDTGVAGFWKLLNFSVIHELRNQRYDALLVHGYEHFAKWLAFVSAPRCTRLILRGESHLNQPRGLLRRAIKRVVLGTLFRRFESFAYLGTLNRQYYRAYGVSPERLHFAPYSVDNDFFRTAALKSRPCREELRRALGIADKSPVIISVGKLVHAKQPERLLRAFSDVRRAHACHLVYVGDGSVRGAIESEARLHNIPNVHITGFVNQTRIPEILAAADIFVLNSRYEPWGLAVNEAMAAGLPVIVSDRVGCARDLVVDGSNGYIVGHNDAQALATRLATLIGNPAMRAEFGTRSAALIQDYSVVKTADGIISAALAPAMDGGFDRKQLPATR